MMAAGVIVGFIAILFLSWIPVIGWIIGPILGGIVSGVISGGGAGRGALSGFLSGIIGYVLVAIGIYVGFEWLGDLLSASSILDWLGIGLGTAIFVAGLFGAFLALIGGAIGGAMRPKKEKKETVWSQRGEGRIGTKVREERSLPENPIETEIVSKKGEETWEEKIRQLRKREQDLRSDLAVLKDQQGTEGISPELVKSKEAELERQLLDIVLERERLARKLKE